MTHNTYSALCLIALGLAGVVGLRGLRDLAHVALVWWQVRRWRDRRAR